MEELIICPECNHILRSTKCDNCNYEIKNEQILIDLIHSEYNNALELCKNKMVYSAWNKMEEVIRIYPFLLIPLEFCFLLAIEFGEYEYANEYLNQIHTLVSEEKFMLLAKLLSTNVEVYNQILSGERISELILEELTFIQLYLLKHTRNNKYDLNEIEGFLNNYSPTIVKTDYRAIKKYKKMIIFFALIASILILLITNLSRHSSGVLKEELNIQKQNKIAVITQLEELQSASVKENRVDSLFILFSQNYYNNKYIDSGVLLVQNPEVINKVKVYNLSFMIENVCDNLYYNGNYELVNKINYESEIKPHAFFKHIMNKVNDSKDRIVFIEEYVERYPLYDYYTAPLLKELFDYYLLNDEIKARKYAIALQQYIENHSDTMYQQWFTEKVTNYLEEIHNNEF
jgi:hypothetical protein